MKRNSEKKKGKKWRKNRIERGEKKTFKPKKRRNERK